MCAEYEMTSVEICVFTFQVQLPVHIFMLCYMHKTLEINVCFTAKSTKSYGMQTTTKRLRILFLIRFNSRCKSYRHIRADKSAASRRRFHSGLPSRDFVDKWRVIKE